MGSGNSKRSNVFQDIHRVATSLNGKFHDDTFKEWWSSYDEQLDLVADIINYVRCGDWETDEEKRQKCICVAQYGYEYAMQKYGVSRSALSKTVCRCEKKLLEKIGVDTVSLLTQGDLHSARASYYAATCKDFKVLYPAGVVELMPVAGDDGEVSFHDRDAVAQVIRFLLRHSRQGVKKRLEALSIPIMKRLLWILQSDDAAYREAKMSVWNVMNTGTNKALNDCMGVLKKL